MKFESHVEMHHRKYDVGAGTRQTAKNHYAARLRVTCVGNLGGP
jgi:hypothetical protein